MEINNEVQGISTTDKKVDLSSEIQKIIGIFIPSRKEKHYKRFHDGYFDSISHLKSLLKKGKIKVNSYFFYQKINDRRVPVTEFGEGCPDELLEEVLGLIDAKGDWGNLKTKAARTQAEKHLSYTLRIFQITTEITSIQDLTINQFKLFINSIRTEENRWKEEVDPQRQKSLRSIALVLDTLSKTSDFTKITTVQRSDTSNKTLDMFKGRVPHMSRWVESWNEYMDAKALYSTKDHQNSFSKFRGYLEDIYKQEPIDEPLIYFSKFRNQSFRTWLEEKVESNEMGSKVMFVILSVNADFANWFIYEYMSETDDDGDFVTIGYPLLPTHKFEELKSKYVNKSSNIKLSESAKLAPPLWMVLRLKEILTENDFSWPKSKSSEYDAHLIDEDGNQVWIPVVTYLYLTMLEIPLRKIQVLRLDSGEGDEFRYEPQSRKWIENDHICAFYWKKDVRARVKNRGVFRRKMTNGSIIPSFSFYINSNKTSDRKEGFGETSGYEIPWENVPVINILNDLRNWQEKFNPVDHPIRHRDIPEAVFDGRHSDVVLNSIPDRFYLFRSGKKIRGGNKQMPPTKQMLVNFWNDLIEELERRLHAEGVDVQLVLSRNIQSNAAQSVLYTPHGLRVAGLTSLAEQGVPIEILSKIVAGHKNILMTIYYIKHHPSHISEILNEAGRKNESQGQDSYTRWLKEASWDQVAKYAVYNSEDAIYAVKTPEANCISNLWHSVNFGICPYGGTRCHDGGSIVLKSGVKTKHGPVDEKNCVSCRHILTGLPWLNQLWVHANALILKSEKQNTRFKKTSENAEPLKLKRMALMREGKIIPAELKMEIKKMDMLMEKTSKEIDDTFNTLHDTHNLIKKIRYIATLDREGEIDQDLPALIIDKESSFKIDYSEAPNNFATLDFVIQASRFYQHEKNENYEREREQFMDAILMRNGYQPLMLMHLSDEEKQQSADAIAKFLITKVDAEILNLLRDGRISLNELGIEKEFSKATAALNSPLKRLEL